MRLEATAAAPELERLVLRDASATVRTHAVRALRRLGEPAAAVPVFLAALQDRDGGVSACAAHQLGVIGDASATEALRRAERDHHFVRRGAYRKAVRRIRRRASGRATSESVHRAQEITNLVGSVFLAGIGVLLLIAAGYAIIGSLGGALLLRVAVFGIAAPLGVALLLFGVGLLGLMWSDAKARRALRARVLNAPDQLHS
jgi:HEAT repeat protein